MSYQYENHFPNAMGRFLFDSVRCNNNNLLLYISLNNVMFEYDAKKVCMGRKVYTLGLILKLNR